MAFILSVGVSTMQDDRAILSDMRDALNCQTYDNDPACDATGNNPLGI